MTGPARALAGYLGALVISWVALVVMMWQALRTLPAAAAMADDRHVRPPMPIDFGFESAKSLGELLLVVVLLWPWWHRLFLRRALVALLLLMAWFMFTVPLDLNTMEWLHRRWLALLIVSLVIVLIAATMYRILHGDRDASTTPG